uniref:Enoyl reductase (ER) domain-containing protein n=1 Tax=Neobodo designis TaxID=312471 RepID=A0A7S1L969_NEODS|mmetsp:Transcript_17372/g.53920  ORF Transcript_17372/g.53920 Transcript_17372/m.53920 type:complete len:230 (+) Transcript_17372:672-1361(+)
MLAKVPDGVSMKEAAVVGLAGNTAYHGLVDNLKFGPNCGKKLLVLGGSTATGMFALQIARHFNCPAIACTSTSEELCKSLGATKVIDYRKEDWSEVLRGEEYDAVFDAMGGYQSYVDSAKVLKKSGTFYSIVGDHPDGTLSFGKMVGVAGAIAFRGRFLGPYYKIAISLPSTPDHGLRFFLGLMAEGKAKAVLDPAEPFEFSQAGAVAMFNKQASGRCKGKLLMCVRAE